MDRKRELTSVDLAALVRELRGYAGAKVDKAYLYDDDLIRLRMRDFDRGRVELFVHVGERKWAHVADPDHVPDAPGRPPNFAMMLRNRIANAELVDVEQFDFDRIITLTFERGDETTKLVAELFGDGNLAVLDTNDEVVDSLETVRLKSRTVAPGSVYEYPAHRFDPLVADTEQFVAKMRQSDADLVRTLATQLNFGGLYGEELCTRADVPYNLAVEEADDDQLFALADAWERMRDRLERDDLDPRVYYEVEDDGDGDEDPERTRVDVTPLPLQEHQDAGLHAEAFDSFTAALDDYYHNFAEQEGGTDDVGSGPDRPDFQAEIEKKERIIAQQEGAIEDFEQQAEAEREKAELLYANYDLVDDVLSTVQAARADDVPWADIDAKFKEGAERGIPEAEAVERVDGSEGSVTIDIEGTSITLEADTGVEKNADRLYTEAKRIAEKKEGALAAIEDTREELAEVKQRRDEWSAEDAEPDPDEDDDEPTDWLAEPSIPVRQSEQWYEDDRWFHTCDGFLVIGGRNADQNEALVKKYMDGGDRFFHAQAHGGPVTILKATGPSEPSKDVDFPESTLQEAAQFALSYSSVWKEGKFADDVYMVEPDQVSKTPESGEYLEKGGFAIRGDRTYFEDVEAGIAVGIRCEPDTRVLGGPPAPVHEQAATTIELEPGRYAQNDMAMMCYREFKKRFADDTFVRKVASADRIQEFLPPGGSRMVEE